MSDFIFLGTQIELAGILSPKEMTLFLLLVIWSLIWKGWSLWIAARKGSKSWFVALLVINTLGILEIFYIFVFSKRSGVEIQDSEKISDEQIKTELEKEQSEQNNQS